MKSRETCPHWPDVNYKLQKHQSLMHLPDRQKITLLLVPAASFSLSYPASVQKRCHVPGGCVLRPTSCNCVVKTPVTYANTVHGHPWEKAGSRSQPRSAFIQLRGVSNLHRFSPPRSFMQSCRLIHTQKELKVGSPFVHKAVSH